MVSKILSRMINNAHATLLKSKHKENLHHSKKKKKKKKKITHGTYNFSLLVCSPSGFKGQNGSNSLSLSTRCLVKHTIPMWVGH